MLLVVLVGIVSLFELVTPLEIVILIPIAIQLMEGVIQIHADLYIIHALPIVNRVMM
jgi:hypothetical protein